MSTTISSRLDEDQDPDQSAGVARSEPGGRAKRRAGAARPPGIRPELADEVKALLPDDVVDELLAGAGTEEGIAGPGGLLSQLTKRLVERAMEVELTDHLGYEPHAEPPGGTGNARNGSTPKRLITEHGEVQIDAPRDRAGSFEPQIVRKRQRRFEGFDDKILALYARGMSTRDISAHLQEIYGVQVGRDLISKVTDAVLEDARAWQTRPLDDVYPVVFLDALVLKIRDGGAVVRKACYLALAINLDGDREVLGLWFQDTEGAKFWMQVLSELKQRGVQDILICCVDGLKGFPDAIEAVFPATTVQTCIVHLIRASLKYVPRRQYDAVVKDLKPVYTAIGPDQALVALDAFDAKWGEQIPIIARMWREQWQHIIPFMAYEPEVRRVIYTTNAIEALNRQLRKAIKTKGSFPSETSAIKLIYLAVQNAVPQWTRTRGWTKAMLAFKIQFGDRLPD
ncbi:MAG: IS256 family transposase [Solirubrobacteraceae bacterium]